MKDELNPKYIFSTTYTSLLVDAVNGKIDLVSLAMNELSNRGLNKDGVWIGFENAKTENEKYLGDLKGFPYNRENTDNEIEYDGDSTYSG